MKETPRKIHSSLIELFSVINMESFYACWDMVVESLARPHQTSLKALLEKLSKDSNEEIIALLQDYFTTELLISLDHRGVVLDTSFQDIK